MKFKLKKEYGITLIALIVTIIILIILASVAISTTMRNGGIVNVAVDSKITSEIAEYKEKTNMAYLSLKTLIISKTLSDSEYNATTPETIENLAKEVAKSIGIEENDIIKTSKIKNERKNLASNNFWTEILKTVILGAETENNKEVSSEGYTIAYSLDVNGNQYDDGNGYITIWYTSNSIKNSIKVEESLYKYQIANLDEENTNDNEAILVSIIQIKEHTAEFVTFTTKNNEETSYGVTSITSANTDISKRRFKDMELNNKVALRYKSIYDTEAVVTFNANGGTLKHPNDDTKTITFGNNLGDLPENPTRNNYNFIGWYTAETGGTKATTNTVVEGNMTLYARWDGPYYTVSLNKDSNINTVSGAGTYKTGSRVTVSASLKSTYTDYTGQTANVAGNIKNRNVHTFTFGGWSGTSSSSNLSYTFTMPDSNVTLNATGIENVKTFSEEYCQTYSYSPSSFSVTVGHNGTGRMVSGTQTINSWTSGHDCDSLYVKLKGYKDKAFAVCTVSDTNATDSE